MYLVTGGAGFIGYGLVAALCDHGTERNRRLPARSTGTPCGGMQNRVPLVGPDH
jgi:nucleoside-diphosphate-sugar epimerase